MAAGTVGTCVCGDSVGLSLTSVGGTEPVFLTLPSRSEMVG